MWSEGKMEWDGVPEVVTPAMTTMAVLLGFINLLTNYMLGFVNLTICQDKVCITSCLAEDSKKAADVSTLTIKLTPAGKSIRSHSTETTLLKVTSDALITADQGKLTLLGMLDLSAAFDYVDHGILLDRLEASFGFSGVMCGTQLDAIVPHRKEAVCEIQWVCILSNSDAVRRS